MDKYKKELKKAVEPIVNFFKKHKAKIAIVAVIWLIGNWLLSEGDDESDE